LAEHKPLLVAKLEELEALVQELRQASQLYAKLKELWNTQTDLATAGVEVVMRLQGTTQEVSLSPNVSLPALSDLLAVSADTAGQRVMDLWGQLWEIANKSKQHCDAAAAAAALQPPTTVAVIEGEAPPAPVPQMR